jgi:hypothetical protein
MYGINQRAIGGAANLDQGGQVVLNATPIAQKAAGRCVRTTLDATAADIGP